MFGIIRHDKKVSELQKQLDSAKSDRDRFERLYRERQDEHDRAIKSIYLDHEIELKRKQFEIDHFESYRIKELEAELTQLKTNMEVANTKLEFMSKLTDVNADVLDVKELVNKLIEKMPSININSIIAGLSGSTKAEVKE